MLPDEGLDPNPERGVVQRSFWEVRERHPGTMLVARHMLLNVYLHLNESTS